MFNIQTEHTDTQYNKSARLSTELIAKTLGIPAEDTRLVEVQRDLLAVLKKEFVARPVEEDYDELSTDEIRDGLRLLEPLYYILPEAMVDAVVEVLDQVLAEREANLLRKRR